MKAVRRRYTKPTRLTPRDMPVMPGKCITCPFREGGDIRIQNSVISRLFQSSQSCHHPQLDGQEPTHICRGARDYQLTVLHRMGWLPEPTDEAFAAESERRRNHVH